MKPRIPYHRPPFEDALNAWKTLLAQKGLSTKLVWVFDENLCFEKDAAAPNGFRLGFQTAFTPPPAAAESIAYDHFCGCDALLVFYRLGAWQDASVCLLL